MYAGWFLEIYLYSTLENTGECVLPMYRIMIINNKYILRYFGYLVPSCLFVANTRDISISHSASLSNWSSIPITQYGFLGKKTSPKSPFFRWQAPTDSIGSSISICPKSGTIRQVITMVHVSCQPGTLTQIPDLYNRSKDIIWAIRSVYYNWHGIISTNRWKTLSSSACPQTFAIRDPCCHDWVRWWWCQAISIIGGNVYM